jgi:hypothetical protein
MKTNNASSFSFSLLSVLSIATTTSIQISSKCNVQNRQKRKRKRRKNCFIRWVNFCYVTSLLKVTVDITLYLFCVWEMIDKLVHLAINSFASLNLCKSQTKTKHLWYSLTLMGESVGFLPLSGTNFFFNFNTPVRRNVVENGRR